MEMFEHKVTNRAKEEPRKQDDLRLFFSAIFASPRALLSTLSPLLCRGRQAEASARFSNSLLLLLALCFLLPAPCSPAADTDGDTMPDDYEQFFTANPANPASHLSYTDPTDGSLDYDDDSLINSGEAVFWTDPYQKDTDRDQFNDNVDANPISRAWIRWGDQFYTFGDEYDYTGPAWWIDAFKTGGEWIDASVYPAEAGWHIEPSVGGYASLNIGIAADMLTRLVMRLDYFDYADSSLYVGYYNTNHTFIANDLFGNLIEGKNKWTTKYLEFTLTDYEGIAGIRLYRTVGEATVGSSLLYVDEDGDGLDAEQEAQVDASDNKPDSDGDTLSDYDEVFVYGTNPTKADTDNDGLDDGTEVLFGQNAAIVDDYSSLPFTENFEPETCAVGDLNGQNGWIASPAGSGLVQANVVYEGAQALQVSLSSTQVSGLRSQDSLVGSQLSAIGHLFAAPAANTVWADMYVKAIASAAPVGDVTEAAMCYFSAEGESALGGNSSVRLVVYDGLKAGSDKWVTLTDYAPLVADSWVRLTVKLDYSQQKWAVFLNAGKIADGLGFAANRSSFGAFGMESEKAYLDNFKLSLTIPDGIDQDADNLMDNWEMEYFGDMAQTPSDDHDQDGLTNLDEYQLGTNPAKADSDNDGMDDGIEIYHSRSPAVFDNYSPLPFTENFESDTCAIGDINGQNGWTALPAGSGLVQANVVYEGAQALQVSLSSTQVSGLRSQDSLVGSQLSAIGHLFAAPAASIVWADMYLQAIPAANPEGPVTGTANFHFNEAGKLVVYDGHSGDWVVLSASVPLESWARVTAKLDYSAQEWTICLNSVMVADHIGFAESISKFSGLEINAGSAYADKLSVSTTEPAGLNVRTIAVEYYVGPAGQDSVDYGYDADHPFKTIDYARQAVRSFLADNASAGGARGDIIVYLRGGTYTLDQTVEFTGDDSGFDGYNVIYRAYPGETPVVSGGQVVTTAWEKDDATGIYFTQDTENLLPDDFRQLYVNGTRAIRARYPNLTDEDTRGGYLFGEVTGVNYPDDWTGPRNYTCTDSFVSSTDPLLGSLPLWTTDTSPDVELVFCHLWFHTRARIATHTSTTVNGNQAYINTFDYPEYKSSFLSAAMGGENLGAYWPKWQRFYENAFEFLDKEGEWYWDKTYRILCYKPRTGEYMTAAEASEAGENMTAAKVVVPKVESLFHIRSEGSGYRIRNDGIATATHNASAPDPHNIQFQGITFEYSTWLRPNDMGYLVEQGATYYYVDGSDYAPCGVDGTYPTTIIPGAIQIEDANHIRIDSCTIRHTGAHGIVMADPGFLNDNTIISNLVTDTSAGGIYLMSGNPVDWETVDPNYPEEIASFGHYRAKNNTISYNTVEYGGRDYTDGAGIQSLANENTSILHNEVRHYPTAGIATGWYWTDERTAANNNTIAYNRVHDVSRLHIDDTAGIYSLGYIPSMTIHDNYVYEIGGAVAGRPYGGRIVNGIGLDQGSCYVTIENNVVRHLSNGSYPDRFYLDAFHVNVDNYAPLYTYGNMFRNNFYSDADCGTINLDQNRLNWLTGALYQDTPEAQAFLARLIEYGKWPLHDPNTILNTEDFTGQDTPVDALKIMINSGPTPYLDSDGDGMPDVWETNYGLDPANHADASLDPDGDGPTNLEEYKNDTNPATSTDSDGDNLADDWEMQIVNANKDDNITTIEQVLPAADFDGDSVSNADEYRLGSSGTDAGSVPPMAAFALASSAVSETTVNTVVPITIQLGSAAKDTVTVRVRVTGGTATPTADYQFTEQIVTFAPGQTSAEVALTIIADQTDGEPQETVILGLDQLTGPALLGMNTLHTVCINDMAVVDTDADGMSDAWEIQYFWDLSQKATDDWDNDGWNNLTEYKRGGNPKATWIEDVNNTLELEVWTPLRK